MLKLSSSPYLFFYLLVVAITLSIFGALVFYAKLSFAIDYFIAINFAVLMVFAYDKRIAGSKNIRVPEIVLYTVALVGGSIGLLLGIKLFRHKTRKASFLIILTLVVLAQLMLIKYLYF